MQILLISGFLGAGKTEFIKTLVGATRKQCVVLENEYGEINFDSGRLKDIKTPDFQDVAVDVEELTEGCICCSMNRFPLYPHHRQQPGPGPSHIGTQRCRLAEPAFGQNRTHLVRTYRPPRAHCHLRRPALPGSRPELPDLLKRPTGNRLYPPSV